MDPRSRAQSIFAKFEAQFNLGRREFGGATFPLVVVRDNETHLCTSECNLVCLDQSMAVFVCPRTLKPHYCGWGTCTAEYEVGPEGKICCLTGNIVDSDASVLSHGWREDKGRYGWNGACSVVGGGGYAERLRPGDDGFKAKIRRRIKRSVAATTTPTHPGREELVKCRQCVRDIFPGSRIRAPHECVVRATALTKAVGAISQYVRTQKSRGKSIAILRVSNLFRKHCARIPKEPLVLPDDGTMYLLSIGYCKVGVDFLAQLWSTAKISPLPWTVAVVALLYLQRRGIEINGTRILGADALLRAWLPAAHTIPRFSVDKSVFTSAKNTIQRAVRDLHSTRLPIVKMTQYTITQLIRIGASEEQKCV